MATSWSNLIKRGYRVHLSANVEGIPYVFPESAPRRVDAAATPAVPAAFTSAIPALRILEGMKLGIEVDRETGVARGDSWDLVLSWEALEDNVLLTSLFKRPGRIATLAATLDSAATTITVDSTAGWATAGSFYLGREYITYTGKTTSPDTFTGCTRGVAGHLAGSLAYDYTLTTPGIYRLITDVPGIWRGRFVELHGHLISPEGRHLSSTFGTGDYHRVLWRGYIDAPPTPTAHGMQLRCLPLVRLAAQELGFDVEVDVFGPPSVGADDEEKKKDLEALPITSSPGAAFTLSAPYSGAGSGTTNFQFPIVTGTASVSETLGEWRNRLVVDLDALLAAEPWYFKDSIVSLLDYAGDLNNILHIIIPITAGGGGYLVSGPTIHVPKDVYWMKSGTYYGTVDTTGYSMTFNIPIIWMGSGPGYLPVMQSDGEAWQDITVPSAGLGILSDGDDKEVIRWVSADTSGSPLVVLHVVERAVGGGQPLSITDQTKLAVSSGVVDAPWKAALKMLESSGTGERGTYDTEVIGQGAGIPDTFIVENSFGIGWLKYLASCYALAEGRSSVEGILGGWYVASGACIVQRTDPTDNDCKLMAVRTAPGIYPFATELSTGDVLIEEVQAPEALNGPNVVKLNIDNLLETPDIIIHDVPRIQAEGPRSMELTIPGMPGGLAFAAGLNLVRMGDGQSILRVTVGPWVDLTVGDPVKVSLAHPLLYDWSAGSRAPATVYGRIVGWTQDLFTSVQTLTILLAGQAAETTYLCPSATLVSKSSSTIFTLTTGEGAYFADGDVITLYNRGEESTREEERTISTVVGDVITVTSGVSTWVNTSTICTYPGQGSATTSQDDFLYVSNNYTWEP